MKSASRLRVLAAAAALAVIASDPGLARGSAYAGPGYAQGCEDFIAVEYGETLADIARLCRVPVAAIIDANPGLGHTRYLAPGKILRVPAAREGSGGLVYKGRHYTEDYLAAGALETDNSGRIFYRVRPGDTLAQISLDFQVPLRAIADLNPHLRPRALDIGDRIYLPAYAERAPGHRRAERAAYSRRDPMASIWPDRGPRDGEILIIGEGFRQGAQVEIYLGRPSGEAVRIRIVEADGDGRVREMVRLPEEYRESAAYWSLRADRKEARSETYRVEPADARPLDGWRDLTREQALGHRHARPASLALIERDARGPGAVALIARDFPPESEVWFYAVDERGVESLLDMRQANFRGEARLEARLPPARRDRYSFYATTKEGSHASAGARRWEDSQGVSRVYDDPLRRAALAEPSAPGFFDRFQRRARETLQARDFVEGPTLVHVQGGNDTALVGVLAQTRAGCALLRDGSGRLHALAGRFDGFGPGERVRVEGRYGGTRGCGPDALRVTRIGWAP